MSWISGFRPRFLNFGQQIPSAPRHGLIWSQPKSVTSSKHSLPILRRNKENQWIFLGKPLRISGKINLFTLLIDTMMSFCVKFPVKFGIETDHHWTNPKSILRKIWKMGQSVPSYPPLVGKSRDKHPTLQ
jgi:hypothetical protein